MHSKTNSASKALHGKEAAFVTPMDCLAVSKLFEGADWIYEVKLDGYRGIGVKPYQGKAVLFSRRRNSLNRKFPSAVEALNLLPEGTVVDGEVVALDDEGRPNFSLLTSARRSSGRICFYVFDLLFFKNQDVMALPLLERRKLLKSLTFKSAN